MDVYEKLEAPAVVPSVASCGSTTEKLEVDDSSQDMNVMACAGEDSRDSSYKSSDDSRHDNCKPRLKPGKHLLDIIRMLCDCIIIINTLSLSPLAFC